jgi:hypothetical protein
LLRFEAAPWLNVSVPFTVMLPLSPEIVELYLDFDISTRVLRELGKEGAPFRIIRHQVTRLSRENEGDGGV